MSANDFRIKFSLRMRFLSSFIIIIVGLILFLLIFNVFFGPFFYQKSREKQLKEAYSDIRVALDSYDSEQYSLSDLEDKIENITDTKEVHAIVVDSNWSVIFVNDYRDRFLQERLLASLLEEYNPNLPGENVDVIEKNDAYVYQKLVGDTKSEDVYEIWGTYPNGYTALCRFTMANIENSVRVLSIVIQISGIVLLAAAIVAALIVSKLITTPLKRLTHIASRISELDFDARYTDNDTSEIGFLGTTMNELSEKLENNITKLKAANLELESDIKNKENLQKQQKDFMSAISHDLKTPIALISGYAEALKEGVAKDPDSINDYCEIIIDESKKMEILIKQMLTINELETGNTELVLERFDIVEMICSVLNVNGINFEKKNISVEFENQNDQIFVWGDKLKIEQVITNYLTNAINHCSGDKLIKINVEQREKTVRTHVWNTGENIPEDTIEEIWNKFYKVDKARTRKYGGNGIGLSIVRSIMEMHSQKCGVENTEKGVDFWFDLDSEKEA